MPEKLIYHDNQNYQTERNAILSFLYYLGKLMDNEMDDNYYCNDSSSCASGCFIENTLNAITNYLSCANAEIIDESEYSNSEWNNLLTGELENGRPIYYTGHGSGGHAFVLDGYFKNWVAYKYHVNWGWCDCYDYNGYYRTGNMTPDGHNFNFYQEAIINIYPTKCDTELDIYAEDKYIFAGLENPNYFNPTEGTIISTPGEDPIIIENDETVHYKAYNKIVLENFETEDGASFTAEIIPCPVNCDFGIAPPTAKSNIKSLAENNEKSKSDEIKLYPNPASDLLTVNLGNLLTPENVTIILFDAFGKKHMQKQFNNRELKIDIKKYPPGVYIIRIDVNGTSHYKKLIKK
ncbi:MAG: C10 family peptidase [Bacteroidales bacterium]